MKTKFKDFLLYSLACVGVVSLFISATSEPKEAPLEAGGYQAVAAGKYIYVVNTSTGNLYDKIYVQF